MPMRGWPIATSSRSRRRASSGRCGRWRTGAASPAGAPRCSARCCTAARKWRSSAWMERRDWRSCACAMHAARNGRSRWPTSATHGWRFTGNRDEGGAMDSSADILTAIREMTNMKQLDRVELHSLLQDGILAALAKRFGPNVQAEIVIDEARGDIKITRLRSVVAAVEDASREVAVEDARIYDDGFEVGDVLEENVDFASFGR